MIRTHRTIPFIINYDWNKDIYTDTDTDTYTDTYTQNLVRSHILAYADETPRIRRKHKPPQII